mgnify:CR=1 FL=1
MAAKTICPSNSGTYPEFDQLSGQAFVRQPVVQQLYAISGSTLWRYVAAGQIPKPRKLSKRCTVWSVAELRAALAARMEG